LGKHWRPAPRFAEIEKIISLAPPRAAMDISDGLTLDLRRLLDAGGVGGEIWADAIPIAAAAREMAAKSGLTPLRHALSDGEDFELLLSFAEDDWRKISAVWREASALAPLAAIGHVVERDPEQPLKLLAAEGAEMPLPGGYEHRW
jgi:thiamine-monophosphate kinase